VLRPDPQTTLTALWGLDQLRACGLPADVMTIVTGEGPEVGPALVDSVDYVMFTGSTATGRAVAAAAAPRLTGVSLELGGKNPMIVRADADVEAAAGAAVRGSFVGAGQVCVSVERIYVHDDVAAAFLDAFVARTKALRFCTAPGWDGEIGTLVNARQLERVASHVADARGRGAVVHAGGRARPDVGPYFFEPTVLGGVTPEMTLHATETFGPVVSVYPVRSDEEAIEAANATTYGLTACVFTRDVARGRVMASRLACGSVGINDAYAATWGSADAPIGGMKDSGLGRRHGREGLLKFTEAQTIAAQHLVPLGPPPGLSAGQYARLLTWALRLRRRIPGLR
jgi:succinate-semialdehyde dehydrogenase/glutarate-semialdehyde dehydrogenase